MSAGCHAMLVDPGTGAMLVTNWEDVLSVVGPIGEVVPDLGWGPHAAGDVRDELDQLDPVSRRIFDSLLLRRYLDVEAISRRSGVEALVVVRALPGLVLTDLIESGPPGYRVAERVRAAQE
jgi:DNA processing protein